ncbi:hypothetical protein L6452_22931 [Arctium lappa]|uniref:Uncharacterized protein n=1 Tax=Arctium lappa TaxID=4217 RepID=A0ACB9B0R2_ARCLA|nr:hypothetical protein L6452_22931 [Arctium lappa]
MVINSETHQKHGYCKKQVHHGYCQKHIQEGKKQWEIAHGYYHHGFNHGKYHGEIDHGEEDATEIDEIWEKSYLYGEEDAIEIDEMSSASMEKNDGDDEFWLLSPWFSTMGNQIDHVNRT